MEASEQVATKQSCLLPAGATAWFDYDEDSANNELLLRAVGAHAAGTPAIVRRYF